MTAVTFDDAKQRMGKIRANLNREVATIQANLNFSDRGRTREMAKTVLAHRKEAERLRNNFTADNEQIRAKLTRQLFGAPAGADASTILVYRDSEERAAKLEKADDAAVMLKRALDRGDTLLARAVAAEAHSKGWADIAENYAAATGLSAELDELDGLPTGPMLGLGLAALFGLPAPPELRTSSDDQLRRIAEGDATP